MTFKVSLAAIALCLVAAPIAARASCPAAAPAQAVEVEAGAFTSAVSGNRGAWNGDYVAATARNANNDSLYARAGREDRFGSTDNTYEAGAYERIAPNAVLNLAAAFSPQHNVLPQNVLGGGIDLRAGGGYGFQAGYAARNYTAQRASILTAGADRYSGNTRVALVLTFAGLSNVSGIAMSETLQVARYLACDTLGASVSVGRDVENVGAPNIVAVYPTTQFDVNDVHWFSPRTALNAGVGWYVLSGAYSRLEVRIALRQRF
jgi:YaiO family outer membrane protein